MPLTELDVPLSEPTVPLKYAEWPFIVAGVSGVLLGRKESGVISGRGNVVWFLRFTLSLALSLSGLVCLCDRDNGVLYMS